MIAVKMDRCNVKFVSFLVVICLTAMQARAQQHPLFTQYMFNGLVINPAYTGSHEGMTLNASLRSQWTGMKGAPQTEVFSGHTPIKFSRSAAGGVLIHDALGSVHQYTAYGTYAYHIPVSADAKISVGGQAGVSYYNANYADMNIVTGNGVADPMFAGTDNRTMPNLGIGAYFYTKKYYVGLSLPTLINNKYNNQEAVAKARQERHYFLSAGYVFELSPVLKLKPNVLLRYVENGPFQYDLNANLLIHEIVWVGVSYRMQDSVDGLLQWNINDQLSFGYSFGYPTTSLATVQQGTHEVCVTYRIKRNKNIVYSPRYF